MKKTKTNVTEQNTEAESTENQQKHLTTFERNISKELLEQFRNAWLNQTWPTELQLRGLFEYWLNISGKSGCNRTNKPTARAVTLVNIDLKKLGQAQSVLQNLNDQRASTSKHDMNLNDHNHSSNQELAPPTIIHPASNNESAPEVLFEMIIDNNSLEIVSDPEPCINGNTNFDLSEFADVVTVNNSIESSEDVQTEMYNEITDDSNAWETDDQTDSIATPAIATATTFASPTINKSIEIPGCETLSQLINGRENDSATANTKVRADTGHPFDKAFTLPTSFLPKKKRIKVESSGKPKLPSAATSDQWMQHHLDKEKKRKAKEEKLQQRKKSHDEKKLLAEEKKKLQDKMKEIQKRIKEETK